MEKRAYLQSILPPGEAASLDLPSSRVDEAVRTQYDLALGHVLARQRAKDPAYADVDVSKLDYKSFFPVAWQIMRDPNILLRRDPNKPDIEEIVHDHSRPRPREPIQPGESRIRDEHGLWFPVPRGVEPPQWEQMLPLGPLMNYKAFWNLFPWVTIGGLMYGFANNFHVGMRRFVMQRGITTTGRAQGMYSIYYLVRSFRSTFRTLPFYLKRGLKRTWATFMPIPLFFAPQTGAERGVSFGIGAYAAYLNMTVLGGKRTMLQRVPRAVASFFIIGTVRCNYTRYTALYIAALHKHMTISSMLLFLCQTEMYRILSFCLITTRYISRISTLFVFALFCFDSSYCFLCCKFNNKHRCSRASTRTSTTCRCSSTPTWSRTWAATTCGANTSKTTSAFVTVCSPTNVTTYGLTSTS